MSFNGDRVHTAARYLMGTPWEVKAYGSQESCEPALEAALTEVDRLERLLSLYREDSELARINRSSETGGLKAHPEVLWLISEAVRYASLSEGAFDPTSGPLIRLWGFGSDGSKAIPPEPSRIRETLTQIGFQNLVVDTATATLHRLQEGTEIDLGGIGKGYAVDRAAQVLKDHGIECALVSCGSTTYALGSPPGLEGWRIGIQHPRKPGKLLESILIRDQAISTSGDYERFFTYDGQRFVHILDPRTGYPVIGMASVTVVSPTALAADALSTAAFVLGTAQGKKLLEGLPGVEGFFVSEGAIPDFCFNTTVGWGRLHQDDSDRSKVFCRRGFLGLLMALTGTLFFPSWARTTVYLTEEAALYQVMPEAEGFKPETVQLTPAQLAKAQTLVGKRFREDTYRFQIGLKDGNPVGYALVLEAIGKEQPITFMVGIDSSGRVKGVEVLIYRESQGFEIRSARFMKQFLSRTLKDPLQLGQDVQGISGATLSSRASTYAVKKALALVKAVYLGEGQEAR